MIFGKGISNEGVVLDMAIDQGLIVKSGSWFSYKDERLGQGRETVKQIINSRPELMTELETKIRAAISNKGGLPFEDGSSDAERGKRRVIRRGGSGRPFVLKAQSFVAQRRAAVEFYVRLYFW